MSDKVLGALLHVMLIELRIEGTSPPGRSRPWPATVSPHRGTICIKHRTLRSPQPRRSYCCTFAARERAAEPSLKAPQGPIPILCRSHGVLAPAFDRFLCARQFPSAVLPPISSLASSGGRRPSLSVPSLAKQSPYSPVLHSAACAPLPCVLRLCGSAALLFCCSGVLHSAVCAPLPCVLWLCSAALCSACCASESLPC